MEITINNQVIGIQKPPYIIAELSANHNGSLKKALETVEAAAHAGADAIKLQTYTAETITMDSDRPDFLISDGPWKGLKLFDLYKSAQTPFEWHREIFNHAQRLGITVFSAPFDETAVDLLEGLGAPAYKIASFEIVDIPLISYAARTGKPLLISTGMASEVEIEEAIDTARHSGCKELALLHCISSYPAPVESSNLKQIITLGEKFKVPIGLSDHSKGNTAAIVAVALGACMIEKHFTLSRADKGPDSEFSIEPGELASLCAEVKLSWASLGKSDFSRPQVENTSRTFRRSIYFVNDLPKGHVVNQADLRSIRPGFGLAPKHFMDLVGLTLSQSVKKGQATEWKLFLETSGLA